MTIKKTKTAFQFILGGIMLASVVTACNNDSADSKDAKTDSTATEKMKEETPAVTPPATDTTPKMDTAATRPLKPGN